MSNYLQQCIQKLTLIPNDTNRYLRLLRDLDKRIQGVQASLIPRQKQFLQKIRQAKEKKIDYQTPQMQRDFAQIVKRQKLIIGYAKQKTLVASQLQQQIAEHTERMKIELAQKNKDKIQDDKNLANKNKKPKIQQKPLQKEQWSYDLADPKYCYCAKPSFGDMVACENTFCEREWFHLECVEQKNLPEKWYCMDCRKLKDRIKNPIQKTYI